MTVDSWKGEDHSRRILSPYNVYNTKEPTDEIKNDQKKLKQFNEKIRKRVPKWLKVKWIWVIVGKGSNPKKEFKLQVNVLDEILGKEYLNNNPIMSFPLLLQGAEYSYSSGSWNVLKSSKSAEIIIESVLGKVLTLWGVWRFQKQVIRAKKYVLQNMYNDNPKFKERIPFDNVKPELVAFKNGTYNMLTNTMIPHDSTHYLINGHNYSVDPSNNESPKTDRILKAMFGDGYITLKEFIGACFYKNCHTLNQALFIHGSGGEGKSHILRYIADDIVDGTSNYSTVKPQDLGDNENNKFKTSRLRYKELNLVADIPDGYIKATDTLKLLTGGDSIDVEEKGLPGYSLESYATFIFSANYLPSFSDDSNGFKDRLITIDTINGDTRHNPEFWNKYNLEEAKKEERSAFVMSCMQSFIKALKCKSYSSPKCVIEATERWINANDHFGEFFKNNLKFLDYKNCGESATEILKLYNQFNDDNGYSRVSMQKLTLKMEKLGIKREKSRHSWKTSNDKHISRFIYCAYKSDFDE